MQQGQTDYFVVLDDAKQQQCRWYQHWAYADTILASDLAQIDELLQQGWQQGLHVVLWQPYDFGVDVVFGQADSGMHLLWFKTCEVLSDQDARLPWHVCDGAPNGLVQLNNTVSQSDYLQRIDEIHAAIARGDVYQINYTTAWQGQAYGSPSQLYGRLRARQKVPYGVLAYVPPQINAGATWHLGFSPELFLRLQSDGVMVTQPMKGTAPILNDGLDQERAHTLQNDAKNRAENVMIVDLLRNDLGKLATVGGVTVPQAFEVNAFGSVWQMTSTVQAQLRNDIKVADILQAAFPCGSITGAPKRMAMQVIAELEQRSRGIYTGSIGYLQPCEQGIGIEGVWNVVIRSLNLTAQKSHLQRFDVAMGIGSGIVIDSVAVDEWDECLWKARFAKGLPAPIGVFETMLFEDGQCALWDAHQERLQAAAQDLQIVVAWDAVWADLQAAVASGANEGLWRVKCQVAGDGEWVIETAPMAVFTQPQQVCVSEVVLPTRDVLRRYKTTARAQYDQVWQQALAQNCFDGLVFNEEGVLLEGGRSNVFVVVEGVAYTPALTLDILNGVMRQAVLRHPERYGFTNGVQECAHIDQAMLQAASHIYLSNALRGLFEVTWAA